MPELYEPPILPQRRTWNLAKSVWLAMGIALVIGAVWYLFFPARFPQLGPQAATGSFVISLSETVKDAQGIPFSGAVLYNASTGAYSYIATQEEGLVTPVGPGAFSSGSYYLAMRAGEDSNDFVLYDYASLSPVRVIADLPLGGDVAFAVWSPDGKTFAYLITGIPLPALMIEEVDAPSSARSPGMDVPIGFSPDSSKLLLRGTSTPLVLNIADGSIAPTLGVDSADPKTRFALSPSGNYLAAISPTVVGLYTVDWNTANLSPSGKVTLSSDMDDVIFAPDDSLVVREQGSDRMRTYTYVHGKGLERASSFRVSLPDRARILHVVSW